MISIREVAKEANVSVATVSRVLNKTGAVADKTRTAVLDAVEKLGYKPNFFGKSLRSSKTNIILVMLSSLANTFCADVIRAIDKTASELGYYIIVCTTNGQKEKEEYYINFACNRLSDGMIILNSSLTESEMSALSEKICLVQCNEYSDMHNTPFVSIDNKKAAYDAVSLLASNGRKRIVFYTVDNEFISTTDRLCGYKQALADNGLEFDRRLVLYGNYGYHNAERGFSEFLERDIPFDAVFAISDRMAAGAMHVLCKNGYKIPVDVEIIGFDNTDISYTSNPQLTTVAQPHGQLGKRAVEQLMRVMRKRETRNIILQHKIVRRDSTKNI